MSNFKSTDTISGKMGRVYIDGVEVGYIKQFEATVTKKKTDVPIVGQLYDGKKTTGLSGQGTLTLYKVSSDFISQVLGFANSGQDVYFTIQGVIEDPSSSTGAERVTLYNCNIDSVKVGQLDSAGAILEEQLPFSFERFDIQDKLVKPN